jgi:hypothetical protein
MHFKLSTAVLATLIGVAISGPLLVRDTATILSDLNTIDSDIATLTKQFNEFTGDLMQALQTQMVEQQLERDIDKATADTKATSALSAADSTSVTNAILGLKPDIIGSLDAIVAKVPPPLSPSSYCRDRMILTSVENPSQLRRRGQSRPLGPAGSAHQDGRPLGCHPGHCHFDRQVDYRLWNRGY